MTQFLTDTEIKSRARMAALFSACGAQVRRAAWLSGLRMNFKVQLDEVADKAGLPAKLGLDLLKIAVFLDRALEMMPSRGKGPRAVNRELAALRTAHGDLVIRLSSLSAEAQVALARVDQTSHKAGELTLRLSEPPIQEVLALLERLGPWLADAQVSTGRNGPKRSPKYFALGLLWQLLRAHKNEATPSDLNRLERQS